MTRSAFESGLLGAEEDGVVVGIIANAVGLAAALALTGDTDRAADFLTRAEQARPAGARELPVKLTKYRALIGTVFLAMKRVDEALAVLGRGLELAEAHGARRYRANLLRLRGEAQTEIGLHEAAIQSLQEGLILATDIGQRAEMVRCCLGLRRVCRARNESSRAKEYLEQAGAIAGDVDMPRELLRIEREISSL
jgi:tetratricopeptide (TPR) repeat protein